MGRSVEVRLSDDLVGWLDTQVRQLNRERPFRRMTRAQLIRELLYDARIQQLFNEET